MIISSGGLALLLNPTSTSDQQLLEMFASLGIAPEFMDQCPLPRCHEPASLQETELDYYGRPQRLAPEALQAWTAMKNSAQADGVVIHLISAYRDPQYQFQLLKRKLEAGEAIADILRINAAPGFSEHHTGRAIDIGTINCAALVTEFEDTPAFDWLYKNAADFQFFMSYPRDNPLGISYEPWHWCFQADQHGVLDKAETK